MRAQSTWLLAGILSLAACATPATPPQRQGILETAQTEIPTSTAESRQATSPPVAQDSPLPTPTSSAEIIISPVETPPISKPQAKNQIPSKLTEATEEAVIIYQRSGGLAGVSEGWAIFPDGYVLAADGRAHWVTPEEVSELLRRIESLGVFDMENEYVPEDSCCDRLTHTLTVRRGDETKTVTALDATSDAPAALWEAVDAIVRLALYQH